MKFREFLNEALNESNDYYTWIKNKDKQFFNAVVKWVKGDEKAFKTVSKYFQKYSKELIKIAVDDYGYEHIDSVEDEDFEYLVSDDFLNRI